MITSRHNEQRADRERLNQTAWDKGSYHVHDDRDGTGTRPQRVNNNSPQTGMEAGESHTVVSKGRGRGSNQNVRQRRKRPEMQIYVPRAKRMQQRGENNPTQNVEPSTNDHNPEDCTRFQNRSASLVTNRVGSEINIERRSLSPQSIGRGRAKPRDRHESKHEQSLKKLRKDNSDSELTSLNRIASTSNPLHDPQTKNVSGTEVHCHENQHVGEVKCNSTDAVSLTESSSNTLISGHQIIPPNPPSVKNDSHKSFQDDGVHSEDCFYDAVVETSIISKCEGAKTTGLLQLEDEKESSDLHSNLSSDSERPKSTNQSDIERQNTVQLNSETKIEACLVENIEVETSQSFDEDASSCPKQHQSTFESSENLDIQVKNKSQGETYNDDHPLLAECEKSFEVMSEETVKGDSQERLSSVGSSDSYTYRQVDSSLVKEVPENVNDNQNHSVAPENQNSSSISGITDSDMHLDNGQGDTKVNVLKDSNELMPEASLHSDGPIRSTTEMEDSGAEHLPGNTEFDKQTTEISAEPVPFSDTIIQPIEDTQNTTDEETMQKDCSNLVSSEMALNLNEIEEEINKNPEGEVQIDSSVEKAAKTEILDEPLMKKLGEDSVHVSVEGEVMETDEGEEESWDKLFTEDGDCLDPKIMEELTAAVGSVQVEKPQAQNYYKYQPKSTDLDFEAYDHVLEISEFPAEFLTRDLISAFQSFMSRGFDIKWVDDTHALGIFSSSIAANEALSMQHPLLKVKPLSEADRQSKVKAKRSVEFLQPYKPRPETSASAARRLVTGALGLAPRVSREKREQERQQMRDAKARRKQDKKNKEDAWEGNYGKCAMDEDS